MTARGSILCPEPDHPTEIEGRVIDDTREQARKESRPDETGYQSMQPSEGNLYCCGTWIFTFQSEVRGQRRFR